LSFAQQKTLIQAIEDVIAEEYSIEENVWRPLPSIPGGPRTQHAAAAFHRKFLFVSGGLDRNHDVLDSMLVRTCTLCQSLT
jgi:hypothetical protein